MAEPREGQSSSLPEPSDVPSCATQDITEQKEHQSTQDIIEQKEHQSIQDITEQKEHQSTYSATTEPHLGSETDFSQRLLDENIPLSGHTNVQPVRGESPFTEMDLMLGQQPASKFSDYTSTDTDHNDNSTDSEHNDNAEDEDWEKIEKEEFDATTQQHVPLPSVILDPSFKATMKEYMGRYKMSDEAKENLKGAWEILKMAGEFGYAVVSEPVYDAATIVVQNQFGCDLDDLPAALRARILASLPENVQVAIRAANRTFRPSGGFVLPPTAHGG